MSRVPAWQLAALVALALYLPWNAERSLWFPDEPDVAEPTMGMLESGDWLVPRRNDEPWLDYPPLTYWLGAASSKLLGGPSPFALRLPVALIAVFLVGLSTRTVERLSDRDTALSAGLVLATIPPFTFQATNFHPDMAFACLVVCGMGLYAWGVTRSSGWRSVAWRVAGFACLGGAVMAKGPLGLLLPGLILVIWHLSFRQWRAVLWLAPLSLVSAAIALPWYTAVAGSTAEGFVLQELYLQNVARLSSGFRGHEQPWYYYFEGIWLELAPWSAFLPGAILAGWRKRWREPVVRLCLLWFLVSFLFLTLATTKRQVYLLPTYPAVAFLIGSHIELLIRERRTRGYRWLTLGFGGLVILLGVLLPALALFGDAVLGSRADLERTLELVGEMLIPLVLLGAGLAAGGIVLLRNGREGTTRPAILTMVALLCFMYTMALGGLLPHLDKEKSYREAAVWLRERSGSERIGYYVPGSENKMPGFRVEDPAFMPLVPLLTPDDAAAYLAGGPRLVVLAAERSPEFEGAVPGWTTIPTKELLLGSHLFLAVGPQETEAVP